MKIFGVGNEDVKKIDFNTQDIPLENENNSGQIALDILDTPNEIIIIAPIAGIQLEDIDITLNKSVITIKGEREKPPYYYNNENVLRNSECYWGRFIRNIILPENLNFKMVKAIMENNLLKISIPKLHIESHNIKINRVSEEF